MKKIRIALAVVIALLAAGLLTLYLLSRQHIASGDTTSLYPYYYTYNRAGELLVHITGEFGTARWQAEADTEAVTVTEKKQTAQKAVFVLHPAASGAARVTLTLREGEDGLAAYRLHISLQVLPTMDGHQFLISGSSHEEPPAPLAGEGEGFTYRVDRLEDGRLLVEIDDTLGQPWAAAAVGENSPAEAARLEPQQTETAARSRFVLQGRGAGQATVWLTRAEAEAAPAAALGIRVAVSAQGEVEPIDCRVSVDAVYEVTDTINTVPDFETSYSGLRLPDTVSETGRGTARMISAQDGVTSLPVGYVSFTWYEKPCRLLVSAAMAGEDVVGDTPVVTAELQTDSFRVVVCGGERPAALWRYGGEVYALTIEGGSTEELTELSLELAEAMTAPGAANDAVA